MSLRIEIQHEPRDWFDGGDRYYVRVWDEDASGFATGWPLALCPTQAAAELIRDAVEKHPERLVEVERGLK